MRIAPVHAVSLALIGMALATPAMAAEAPAEQILPAPDPSAHMFGRTVAVFGDTLVVGAPADEGNGYASGAAYVFQRLESEWVPETRLTPRDPAPGAYFGNAVAVYGDTLVVGGFMADGRGAVYVFRKDGAWREEIKLAAGLGLDHFGLAVGIHRNTVVVGAPANDALAPDAGAAYVFSRRNAHWRLEKQLLAQDGHASALFGWAVAVDGDRIAVGAIGTPFGSYRGAAYVFDSFGREWRQQGKLAIETASPWAKLGASVAIEGDRVIVGAVGTAPLGSLRGSPGAAYLFERDGDEWIPLEAFVSDEPADGDAFGRSVAIHRNRIVISADQDDGHGVDAGAIYVFERRFDGWFERERLMAQGTSGDEHLGYSLSLHGRSLAAGTTNDVACVFEFSNREARRQAPKMRRTGPTGG